MVAMFRWGNLLYRYAPALYRPLYAAYKASSDKAERRWLKTVVEPGMTVVDLGANIGTTALFLADLVGPQGKVYAFEPEPRNFSMLSRAVARRGNVVAVNAAVGDRTGTLDLYLSRDLNVDHHAYDDGKGRQRVEVPVWRLDDFFPPDVVIGLLKSDIQGFETHALRGAQRLLAASPQVKLLLEYWPWGLRRAGSSAEEFLVLLGEFGFAVHEMGKPLSAQPALPEREGCYCNVIAVRPDAGDWQPASPKSA